MALKEILGHESVQTTQKRDALPTLSPAQHFEKVFHQDIMSSLVPQLGVGINAVNIVSSHPSSLNILFRLQLSDNLVDSSLR